METSVKTVRVHTERTFAIARSSADTFERVIFEMSEDGVTGRGEAAPTSYYGQDAQGVVTALESVEVWDPWDMRAASRTTERCHLPRSRPSTTPCTTSRPGGSVPVYRLLGLARPVPVSAYTRHSRQGVDRRPRAEAEQAPDTEGKGRRVERHRDAQGREGVIGGRTLGRRQRGLLPRRGRRGRRGLRR